MSQLVFQHIHKFTTFHFNFNYQQKSLSFGLHFGIKNRQQSVPNLIKIGVDFSNILWFDCQSIFKPINHPKTPPGRPQGVSKKPIPPTIFMPWAPRLPTSLPSRAQDGPEAPQSAPDRLPRQPNRPPSDPKSLKSRSHI